VERLRKIAEEVAGPAGPKSNEMVDDLIKKLQLAVEPSGKPLDIRELNFKEDPKGSTNQALE